MDLTALGFRCCAWLSLVATSRGYSLAEVRGRLVAVASLLLSTGPREHALGSCGTRAVSKAVECFQTRDRTHVPCLGRQILNPWTSREV